MKTDETYDMELKHGHWPWEEIRLTGLNFDNMQAALILLDCPEGSTWRVTRKIQVGCFHCGGYIGYEIVPVPKMVNFPKYDCDSVSSLSLGTVESR